MSSLHTLAATVCMALSVMATTNRTDKSQQTSFCYKIALFVGKKIGVAVPGIETECDFSGLVLDSAVANVLSKLPTDHVPEQADYQQAFQGFGAGPLRVIGLNKMRRYGPLLPYCINNTRMLQFELVSIEDTFLSLPWRVCTGHEGTLRIKADMSYLTVALRVELQGSGGNVKFVFEGPTMRVSAADTWFEITGIGNRWEGRTRQLSMLIPGITRHVWNLYFVQSFGSALYYKALSE